MDKHLFCTALTVVALSLFPTTSSGQLIINEIMQSNIDCLFVDKEFPDSWVEVYNAGDKEIALNGYSIGSSKKVAKAFKLETAVKVAPRSHAVIYCDKTGEGLHADFRLESNKSGSVYLFDPSGNEADKLDYPEMAAPNVAYGRVSDGGEEWGNMISSSPGASNHGGVSSTLLPEPVFTHAGGVCKSTVVLTVSKPEGCGDDVKLCITTDGREPDLSNATTGVSRTLTISKSTSVRAKLISPNALSPVSTAHSYIFHSRTTDLPIVSITINPDYLYDKEIGIFMGELDKDPNWGYDWRRPMNVEVFDGGNHETLVSQLGETRVKGGWSRRYSQKSMVFYANKRFGEKRFDTSAFWPEKPEITSVKSFELRNSGTDFEGGHMRDALAQRLVGLNQPNVDWQAYRLVVCYINGEYRGIYDMRERSNEDYVEANYNGLEDIDMVENWYDVKVGDGGALWNFTELYNKPDLKFSELEAVMDVDNFLNMFAMNTFAGNTDYPHNNIVCWKPTAEGSLWRWVLKDIDRFALTWEQGQHEHDYLKFIADMAAGIGSDQWTSRNVKLFGRFLELPEAKNLFIDRLAVFMGDFLQPGYVDAMVEQMRGELKPEYEDHCKLYFPNDWWWRYNNSWPYEVDFIKDWCKKRRTFLYNRLRTYFSLSSAYELSISTAGQPVKFNGIELSRPYFTGNYYNNRDMKLEAPSGYVWKSTVSHASGATTSSTTSVADYTFNYSNAKSVKLELVAYDPSGVECVLDGERSTVVESNGLIVKLVAGSDVTAAVYRVDGSLVGMMDSANPAMEVPSAGIYIVDTTNESGERESFKVVCR